MTLLSYIIQLFLPYEVYRKPLYQATLFIDISSIIIVTIILHTFQIK